MKHIGRKFFHLLGGVGLLSLYYVIGRERAFPVYGVLFIAVLLLEAARLKLPSWNRVLYRHFGSFIRESEKGRLSGTAPYVAGIGLTLYLYSAPVASSAICFLAFGDVAATTIGERFGSTRIGNKSLEGSAAFIAASLVAGFVLSLAGLGVPPWIVVIGSLAAAGIELLPIPVNDNLTIPVLAGAVMSIAANWA